MKSSAFKFSLRELMFMSLCCAAAMACCFGKAAHVFSLAQDNLNVSFTGGLKAAGCILVSSCICMGIWWPLSKKYTVNSTVRLTLAATLMGLAMFGFNIYINRALANLMYENEWVAYRAAKEYGYAQNIYVTKDHDGDGVLEYAQHLQGNFSLLETSAGKSDLNMIPSGMARAEYQTNGTISYHGSFLSKIRKVERRF